MPVPKISPCPPKYSQATDSTHLRKFWKPQLWTSLALVSMPQSLAWFLSWKIKASNQLIYSYSKAFFLVSQWIRQWIFCIIHMLQTWQLTILVQCNPRIKEWFLYIALQNKVSFAPGSSQRNFKLLPWWKKAVWLDPEMQCVHKVYFMVNVTDFWPCTIPAVVADFRT